MVLEKNQIKDIIEDIEIQKINLKIMKTEIILIIKSKRNIEKKSNNFYHYIYFLLY